MTARGLSPGTGSTPPPLQEQRRDCGAGTLTRTYRDARAVKLMTRGAVRLAVPAAAADCAVLSVALPALPKAPPGPDRRLFLMAQKWWTLTAVVAGMFMLLLDVTIVNVALPQIGPAYEAITPEDSATAARVLTAITAKLNEERARS